MEIGLALPHLGQETTPAFLARMAREAEQLGYASLWAGERLLRPRHYVPFGSPPGPMPDYFKSSYDPLETLAYVAAVTQRIKLGSSVIVPAFHTPVILARQFATLDHFSEGRVLAGLGQGWLPDEFAAANVPFTQRGDRLEDFVGALRACWGSDPVRYAGRFYSIIESDIGPKPLQLGGPPLLFGAVTRAALKRAARLVDGLNPIAHNWRLLEWMLPAYDALVREAGRDPTTMMIVVRSNHPVSLTGPLPEPRPPLSGSLEQIREDVQRLAALGIQHLFFDLVSLPVDQQLELLPRLRRVAD
jgi:probable F420-dependent oxidoreductase